MTRIISAGESYDIVPCMIGYCHSHVVTEGDIINETKNCYDKERHPLDYWRSMKADDQGWREVNQCYHLNMWSLTTVECLCDTNLCNGQETTRRKVRKY